MRKIPFRVFSSTPSYPEGLSEWGQGYFFGIIPREFVILLLFAALFALLHPSPAALTGATINPWNLGPTRALPPSVAQYA